MQARAEQPPTKHRRLILKQERVTTQGAHESLEGVSYQSVRGRLMPHLIQIAAADLQSGR
ncbi:hypothetical protein KP79_PYT12381 [Mizuhopecten yessoensis]|uniref:Uncharacterized protein n=1 Tax=Mizuhopecten yessoensis TaxID=6573 RepID=A0A210PL45_MIZYE|nr:hypothetical protein KP79_PYT12381 [Mizuhopecten yessoensis]